MKLLDPIKQAQAVQAIKDNLAALGEDDDAQLLLDSIEGETDFFEVVDSLLQQIQDDGDLASAASASIDRIRARKQRFEKRAETTKSLLEQAFVAAGLPKVERPTATLFIASRAPKVVIETESEIPAKFWKPADPTLDKKALADELKERRKDLDAVLAADEDSQPAKVDAFCQRYLDHEQAERFRATLPLCQSDEARSALRLTFAAVPGATLVDSTPSLSIRSA